MDANPVLHRLLQAQGSCGLDDTALMDLRVSAVANTQAFAVGGQPPAPSRHHAQARSARCRESGARSGAECRPRRRATCRQNRREHQLLRASRCGMHPQQADFARNTKEMLRGSPPPPEAEPQQQSASKLAQPRSRIRPRYRLERSLPQCLPALSEFLAPSLGNRGVRASFQAVEERHHKGRPLVRRKAQDIGQQLVHARVHEPKSTLRGPRLPAASTDGVQPFVAPTSNSRLRRGLETQGFRGLDDT